MGTDAQNASLTETRLGSERAAQSPRKLVAPRLSGKGRANDCKAIPNEFKNCVVPNKTALKTEEATFYPPTAQGQRAIDKLQTPGSLVFATGAAGTGKSQLIHWITHKTEFKNVLVAAPTGLAAVMVGGQTLHSLFAIPIEANMLEHTGLKHEKKALFKAAELLIVDEASMVSAQLCDSVNIRLQQARGNNKPFGGLRVLFVGDPWQLPPVVKGNQSAQRGYASDYFFSAKVFEQKPLECVVLGQVFRQKDPVLHGHLQSIRSAKDFRASLAYFNNLAYLDKKNQAFDPDAVYLVSTNAQAQSINTQRLALLEGKEQSYQAMTTGRFTVGEERVPAAAELVLKPQAQVVLLKNKKDLYQNGELATVVKLNNKSVLVRLSRSKEEVLVVPETWENLVYELDKDGQVKKVVQGTYTQLPLALGFAITIHRAQGLTLPKINVDLSGGVFAPGMLYVALSRCVDIQGVRLITPLRMGMVHPNPAVESFFSGLGISTDAPAQAPISPLKPNHIDSADCPHADSHVQKEPNEDDAFSEFSP